MNPKPTKSNYHTNYSYRQRIEDWRGGGAGIAPLQQ
jgi:hypothetical protein